MRYRRLVLLGRHVGGSWFSTGGHSVKVSTIAAIAQEKTLRMACPYFMPTRKSEVALWPHPERLPLGAGWEGLCCAQGNEATPVNESELKDFCNLGYASCGRVPQARTADAVRFAIASDGGNRIGISFVFEAAHEPAGHGTLEYDTGSGRWSQNHENPRVQKMAECYLEAYLLRRIRPAAAGSNESPQ